MPALILLTFFLTHSHLYPLLSLATLTSASTYLANTHPCTYLPLAMCTLPTFSSAQTHPFYAHPCLHSPHPCRHLHHPCSPYLYLPLPTLTSARAHSCPHYPCPCLSMSAHNIRPCSPMPTLTSSWLRVTGAHIASPGCRDSTRAIQCLHRAMIQWGWSGWRCQATQMGVSAHSRSGLKARARLVGTTMLLPTAQCGVSSVSAGVFLGALAGYSLGQRNSEFGDPYSRSLCNWE